MSFRKITTPMTMYSFLCFLYAGAAPALRTCAVWVHVPTCGSPSVVKRGWHFVAWGGDPAWRIRDMLRTRFGKPLRWGVPNPKRNNDLKIPVDDQYLVDLQASVWEIRLTTGPRGLEVWTEGHGVGFNSSSLLVNAVGTVNAVGKVGTFRKGWKRMEKPCHPFFQGV